MTHVPEISLVMPCYNEEDVVEATVADLFDAFEKGGHVLELVAVDNGSTDRTGEILNGLARGPRRILVPRVAVNQGYGNGLLAGLRAATAPWVGILCADGQVEAADVVKLFEIAQRSRDPKLVKVRRRFRMDGWKRKVTSIVYNGVITVLFPGLGSIDINGNPKILPRDFLERMQLESRDWFLDAEIMIKARRLGLPVFELNVLGQMREGGASNVRLSTLWEFVVNLALWRLTGSGRSSR